MVVHEHRTALSGIAVTEAPLGRHDADEQSHELAWNFAAAERTIQLRHGAGRTIVPLGLDGEHALHERRLEAAGAPLPQTSPNARRKWPPVS